MWLSDAPFFEATNRLGNFYTEYYSAFALLQIWSKQLVFLAYPSNSIIIQHYRKFAHDKNTYAKAGTRKLTQAETYVYANWSLKLSDPN